MKEIDAEKAFELMYELYKAHPWLNKPGTMRPEDAPAEAEAVAFLLAGDFSRKWKGCSPAARRVAASLLLDFMAKLRTPGHPISSSSWTVPANLPPWRQALAVIGHEIRAAHPRLAERH